MNSPNHSDSLSPLQLKALLDSGPCQLVDVREPVEHAEEHLAGALLIPLGDMEKRCSTLDRARPIFVHCRGGVRGAKAAEKLRQLGFTEVRNLEGGLMAWKSAGLPVVTPPRQVLPLMRQVQITVGVFVLAGSALTHFVHPGFLAVPAFFGAGLLFAGSTGWCGLAMLLAKMPWNRQVAGSTSCSL